MYYTCTQREEDRERIIITLNGLGDLCDLNRDASHQAFQAVARQLQQGQLTRQQFVVDELIIYVKFLMSGILMSFPFNPMNIRRIEFWFCSLWIIKIEDKYLKL